MTPQEEQNQLIFDQTESLEREEYLTNQLIAFNQAHTTAFPIEHIDPSPLHLYVLDQAGIVVGGLVGRTHQLPMWLEISIIWIEERYRHHGLGRQLIERAEQEAIRRGCHYARLATSNFQAPAFYQKLGYILYGLLENCPPGETALYFWKTLSELPDGEKKELPVQHSVPDGQEGAESSPLQ